MYFRVGLLRFSRVSPTSPKISQFYPSITFIISNYDTGLNS